MDYRSLEEQYNELINPVNIRKIQTDEQFVEWCNSGSIEDLECTLRVFVEAEMYEDCAVIRDVLQRKTEKK